jgi:autotransporter-associated beta strand protein
MRKNKKQGWSASRALAMACAAVVPSAVAHADSTICEYQFTSDALTPTTSAANLVGTAFTYVNANPSDPPLTNPAFIVQGSSPDPPYYIGQGDWFPTWGGYNENYFAFSVTPAPGYSFSASSASIYANSRQAVLMDAQIAYSTSPSFSSPVNFDTSQFLIPAVNTWNTFTASDAPITDGTGTYYFRIYGQLDQNGSGTISDLLNLCNITLTGSMQTSSAVVNVYWDPSDAGALGSGGAGTWTGTTAWAEGPADFMWNNAVNEVANFGGTTGSTVAMGGSVTALNGINFTTAGYNITGTSGQVLTVGGTIDASTDATISASLTTYGALTKAGAGTLTLAGAASFGTGLAVTGGSLKLVADTIDCSTADISSGAVLEYNDSANTYQTPITYTGAGTLRLTGSGNLIFGAYGAINIDLSPGALVDVEGGTLTGSSSYGGNWTSNQASLNIAGGAVFNAVEAGLTATMQIDALTGAGNFLGGYFGNTGGLSTVTIGIANGSGTFSGSLQDNPGAHLGITKTGAGTETFTGSNTYSGGTIVSGGKLFIGAAAALPDSSVAIDSSAELQLAPGIGRVSVTSLSIAPSALLDLTNDHMYIDYAPGTQATADATIRGYLISGRNGGAWNGTTGIITTGSTGAGIDSGYGIGYADGADGVVQVTPANPSGLSTGQIEIKYTLLGDATLDGVVSGDDFTILGTHLGPGTSNATWDEGDFNYDGLVNGDDFTLLVKNLGKSDTSAAVVQLPAADYDAIDAFAAANGFMADVPEPATSGLAFVAAFGLLRRRRFRP